MEGNPPTEKISINGPPSLPGAIVKPLSGLPNELIILIGEQLSNQELALARQTSKFLNALWAPVFFRRGWTHIQSDGNSALDGALLRKDELIVRRMLEARPSLSATTTFFGLTPLHMAAGQGLLDMAKLFLEAGADILLLSKFGDTPLHQAASHGKLEVVQLLLDFASSTATRVKKTELIERKRPGGATAVVAAARARERPVVDFLISHGADTTVEEPVGGTVLHSACELGFPDQITKLLQEGTIDINSRDCEENTPLHLAASSCCVDAVKLLIDAGADISARGESGYLPLHRAAWCPNPAMVKLLLDAGADIDALGSYGETALHHVCYPNSSVDTAKELVKAGANIHAVASNELTTIWLAEEAGNTEMVRFLVAAGLERPE